MPKVLLIVIAAFPPGFAAAVIKIAPALLLFDWTVTLASLVRLLDVIGPEKPAGDDTTPVAALMVNLSTKAPDSLLAIDNIPVSAVV